MAISLILPNDKLILSAFAAVGQAPGNANLSIHRDFVKTYGVDAYTKALSGILDNAGVTNADLANLVIANFGLSSVAAATPAFLTSYFQANAANRAAAVINLANTVSTWAGDAAYNGVRDAFNDQLNVSYNYAVVAANTADKTIASFSSQSHTYSLTTALDVLSGTTGVDLFNAYIVDNSNTLQSGDVINGGAGADKLFADIGNSQKFAITAQTTGVETVAFRAQAVSTDSTDNNTSSTNEVQIDAQRMSGVTTWENTNSRADLLIEDVRIQDNQITKDITIVMRETDPGHVDYGVYFDQNSLRTVTSTSSQINLQVMDTRSVVDGTAPLKNSPYGGFRFTSTDANGVATVITLQSQAIDDAQTYEELVTAFQAAANATLGTGVVTVTLGSNYTVTDTTTGTAVSGKEVVLKAAGDYTFSTPAGSGWIANGVVPANSGLHTNFNQQATANTDLVTSKIILDDVGRGSTGGDLVIGGLSVGDTSLSKGVQRFEITVEDNSKLETINSTNNTLREVTIVNGTTTRVNNAYNENEKNAGALTVNGLNNNANNNSGAGAAADQNINKALPGTDTVNGGNQHNQYGFSDVRLIDGSAMTGKLAFTAELTSAVVSKYMTRVDTQVDSNADDAQFVYTLGSNNDSLTLDISSSNLEAAGATARDDFNLVISGGAGDDTITTDIIGPANLNEGNGAFWYQNSKHNANLRIESGTGDDTVTTTGGGDFVIVAGEGNDTVYADNSGAGRGAWIFNAKNNDLTNLAGWSIAEAMDDAAGAGRDLFKDGKAVLYKAQLTVTLSGATTEGSVGVIDGDSVKNVRGFESTVTIETNGYLATQAQINQAIKKAINSDPVLSKLASAQDGPDNTVVVTSKVDGTFTAGDLDISIKAADLTKLSATEVAGLQSAYKTLYANSKLANLTQADLDYIAGRAQELNDPTAAELAATNGKGSIAASDNTINLGTGDDVAVLGTGGDSNDTIVWTGYGNGKDTIVNFTNGGSAQDYLDFSDYLRTKKSESGSVESTKLIPFAANADKTAEANTVTVVKFVESATDKFDALTASKLLSVFNSDNVTVNDPAAAAFGGLNGATLEAEVGVYPAGTVRDHVVMVENGTNSGVYKIFHLTSVTGDKGGSFATAQEIVTADFGASLMGYVGGYANLGTIVSGLASGFNPGENNPTNPTNPTNGTDTVLAAGTTADAVNPAGANVFSFTVADAKAITANTQIKVPTFVVADDSLKIDTTTALGNVKLSALNGVDGIAVQSNPIANEILVNFGADANGDVITVTLTGVSDASTVNVSVI